MMFTSTVINAQIVYTDVNPDVSVSCSTIPCTSTYPLDLNNDGITDFNIIASYTSVSCFPSGSGQKKQVSVSAQNGNKVVLNMMNANDTIGSNLSFSLTSGILRTLTLSFTCPTSSGNWTTTSDHYLGLQLSIGSSVYYGWARLNVYVTPGGPHFNVKDYAYNTVANQIILAGQTCSPQATIKANGPLSFCSGGSVVLTSKNSGNTLKYQWKKNNININGATNKNYTATTAGDYKVKVTDTINNCYKTSGIKTVIVPCRETNEVFTEQLENVYELKIAPNPLSNSTMISFTLEQSENVSLKIFDVNERLIKTLAENVFAEGEHAVEWNAENVNAGIYFLQVQSAEFSKTEKLVITK